MNDRIAMKIHTSGGLKYRKYNDEVGNCFTGTAAW